MTFGWWTLIYGSFLGLAMLVILLLEIRDQRRDRKRLFSKAKNGLKKGGKKHGEK